MQGTWQQTRIEQKVLLYSERNFLRRKKKYADKKKIVQVSFIR
jgi:hypothetical protein